ncbi:hypothetical protein KCU71_g6032, partial [Aureobasidium melanogenum]
MSSEELDSESNPWDWAILRTCYTPESEDLWPTAIRLIDAWLDHKTRLSLRNADPSLENASFDQLRSRFAAWLATQDTDDPNGSKNLPLQRFKNFIFIDSSVLQSTKDAPSPDNRQAKASERMAPYVKVVAPQHLDGTRLPPATSARSGRNADEGRLFPGFMRVSIIELRMFWEGSFTYDLCPNNFANEPD